MADASAAPPRPIAQYEVVAPKGLVVRDGAELNCRKVATLEKGLVFSVFEIHTSLLGLTRLRTELGWVGGKTAEGIVLAKPKEVDAKDVSPLMLPISRPPPVACPPPVFPVPFFLEQRRAPQPQPPAQDSAQDPEQRGTPLPKPAAKDNKRKLAGREPPPAEKSSPLAAATNPTKRPRQEALSRASEACDGNGDADVEAAAPAAEEDKRKREMSEVEVAQLERKLQELQDDLKRRKVKRRTTGKRAPEESIEAETQRQAEPGEPTQAQKQLDEFETVVARHAALLAAMKGPPFITRKRKAQEHAGGAKMMTEQRAVSKRSDEATKFVPLHPLSSPLAAPKDASSLATANSASMYPPPGDWGLEPAALAPLSPPPGDWDPLPGVVDASTPKAAVEPPPGDWEPSADPWFKAGAASLGKSDAESLGRDAYALRTILKAKRLDHNPTFVAVIGRLPEKKLSERLRGIFLRVRYQKFCGRSYYQFVEQGPPLPDAKNGIGSLVCQKVFIFWSAKTGRWKISNALDEQRQGYAWCAEDCFLPEEAKCWMVYEGSFRGYVKDSGLAVVPLQFFKSRSASALSSTATPAPPQSPCSTHGQICEGDDSGIDDGITDLEAPSDNDSRIRNGNSSNHDVPLALKVPSSREGQRHDKDGSVHDAPSVLSNLATSFGQMHEGHSSTRDESAVIATAPLHQGQIREGDDPVYNDTLAVNAPLDRAREVSMPPDIPSSSLVRRDTSVHDTTAAVETSPVSCSRGREGHTPIHDLPTALRLPSSERGLLHERNDSSNDVTLGFEATSATFDKARTRNTPCHDTPTALHLPSSDHGQTDREDGSNHGAPAAVEAPTATCDQAHTQDMSCHDAPTARHLSSSDNGQKDRDGSSGHDAPSAPQLQSIVHREKFGGDGCGPHAKITIETQASCLDLSQAVHSSCHDAPTVILSPPLGPSCSSHDAPTDHHVPPVIAPLDHTSCSPAALRIPPRMSHDELTPEVLLGTWIHSKGGKVVIGMDGDKFLIQNPHGGNERVAIKRFIREKCLSYWGNEGMIDGNVIKWSNGSTWVK